MTRLSKAAFVTKYNDASAGLYKAGQTDGIGSDDHRTQIEDSRDSFLWPENLFLITAYLDSPLPAYTYNPADGSIVANANGALPDIDDVTVGTGQYIIVNGETDVSINDVYYVVLSGSAGLPFALLRQPSVPSRFRRVLYVNSGTSYSGQIYVQSDDNKATREFEATGTIATGAVLTLNGTPVGLVSDPGAGIAVAPTELILTMDYNSAAYATNTKLQLTAGSNVITEIEFFLDASADRGMVVSIPIQDLYFSEGIFLTVADGNPTAGNSAVKWKLKYKIITI